MKFISHCGFIMRVVFPVAAHPGISDVNAKFLGFVYLVVLKNQRIMSNL